MKIVNLEGRLLCQVAYGKGLNAKFWLYTIKAILASFGLSYIYHFDEDLRVYTEEKITVVRRRPSKSITILYA